MSLFALWLDVFSQAPPAVVASISFGLKHHVWKFGLLEVAYYFIVQSSRIVIKSESPICEYYLYSLPEKLWSYFNVFEPLIIFQGQTLTNMCRARL